MPVSQGPLCALARVTPTMSASIKQPMAAVTNAFNLAHAGVYGELQSIPPGGQWRESFWIRPSGF